MSKQKHIINNIENISYRRTSINYCNYPCSTINRGLSDDIYRKSAGANNMAERFHFIMRPFFHSFTNYTKFISSFKSCFSFRGIEAEEYIKRLKDDLEQISRIGGKSIISGQ